MSLKEFVDKHTKERSDGTKYIGISLDKEEFENQVKSNNYLKEHIKETEDGTKFIGFSLAKKK